jgi:hypothetical protein
VTELAKRYADIKNVLDLLDCVDDIIRTLLEFKEPLAEVSNILFSAVVIKSCFQLLETVKKVISIIEKVFQVRIRIAFPPSLITMSSSISKIGGIATI